MTELTPYRAETSVSFADFNEMISKIDNAFVNIGESINKLVELQTNTNRQIGELSTEVVSLKNGYSDLSNRMDIIETKEEITTSQVKKIQVAACRRIYSILGEDEYERQKYFRSFISRLYSDAKKYSSLGHSISTTKKGDFNRVIDYIEAWIPTGGISKLKRSVDEIAHARQEAKANGYI